MGRSTGVCTDMEKLNTTGHTEYGSINRKYSGQANTYIPGAKACGVTMETSLQGNEDSLELGYITTAL